MDINNKNIKIYTFKLDVGNILGYILYLEPELHNIYMNTNIFNRERNFNINDRELHTFHEVVYTLYDVNNNQKKLINLCHLGDKNEYNWKYYLTCDRPSNNFKTGKILASHEENNIYIKEIYTNSIYTNCSNDKYKLYPLKYAIYNNKLIHILINNFCKLHHIENINITLQKDKHMDNFILEMITFIIDETKESNNRKIKFYEHFSDFYRTKNKNINYKIIQEPIGDGHCLIEELEELDAIQDITQPIEKQKSQEDIIKEKDTEIDKLKREIQELKKFYINL